MKKILKDKRIIIIVIIAILVLLLMNFNQRMMLLSTLREQEHQLATEFAQLEATQLSLQTEIAYANSDEAVEEWAREQAGMVQEGDIPIILLPSGPTPTISAPKPTERAPIDNWEIWQALFFDE